jgi:hypothetical protein
MCMLFLSFVCIGVPTPAQQKDVREQRARRMFANHAEAGVRRRRCGLPGACPGETWGVFSCSLCLFVVLFLSFLKSRLMTS